MNEEATTPQTEPSSGPRWQPLSAIERRVGGVLVEKAKTTPEGYPMSLKAIVTACNQKNNRAPVMQLESEDVEEALDRLRALGAVGMIEGYGRVAKYRHYLYEWLGVEKVELAVMAELLLRGAQTEGDLRSRAARMEPLRDLSALRPVLASLQAKGLIVALSPEGRGRVLAHALYPPGELTRLKQQYAEGCVAPASPVGVLDGESRQPAQTEATQSLRSEVAELRSEVSQMRDQLNVLTRQLRDTEDNLRALKDTLGG